jgi:hypothetical protein
MKEQEVNDLREVYINGRNGGYTRGRRLLNLLSTN